MAWKPRPRTYVCPQCKWKKTVAPLSDVRWEGFDHFSKCPKCDNSALVVREPGVLELAILGWPWWRG